jgi:hypothetical protein
MQFDVASFRTALAEFLSLVSAVEEPLVSRKPAAERWSLKEITGHLIDSAANNHQRFVRLRAGRLEGFPGYDQELWVAAQAYNDADWELLRRLWALYNEHLLRIVGRIDAASMETAWHVDGRELSLEWLVNDYYRHLRWHIEQFRGRLAEIAG